MPEKFRIVACCNRSPGKAESYAEMVGGIPYTTDYRDLLRRPEVEAVVIALPIHLNCEMVQAALEAEKHVFLEKPLAGNLAEAEMLLALETGTSLVTFLAENFRYVSAYRKMRALLDEGVIGRPYAMVFDDFNYIAPEMEFANTPWRVNHEHLGGIVLDGGAHRIAAIRVVVGAIRPVGAFALGAFPTLGRQDMLSLLFAAEGGSGIKGVYTAQFSRQGHSFYRMTAFGTEGDLVLEAKGSLSNFTIQVKKGNAVAEEFVCDDGGLGYLEGFKGEFEDFFRNIREGTPVQSSFEEGYKDFRVISDALELAGIASQ
jgi:predicted dehydrogenase